MAAARTISRSGASSLGNGARRVVLACVTLTGCAIDDRTLVGSSDKNDAAAFDAHGPEAQGNDAGADATPRNDADVDASVVGETGTDAGADSGRTDSDDGAIRDAVPGRDADAATGDASETCPEPLAPVYGRVTAPKTTVGSMASYTCTSGYVLQGSPTRTCGSDGSWSATMPSCAPVDCGAPANPANGVAVAAVTTYGQSASYSCNTGWSLTGASSRTCQADRSWSGEPPICNRSCAGRGEGAGFNCGSGGTDDCCASPIVVGGTFYRDNNAAYSASVSNFRLDKYPITAGRFRAFAAMAMGTQANPPAAGSGANPALAGSGWMSTWNSNLDATRADLEAAVQCGTGYSTWNGADDRLPMNCLNWYQAFAFCVWDGGRLPTELEWNYAAAGGNQQRKYPWGSDEPGADTSFAAYGCYYGGGAGACTGLVNIAPVGSSPKGVGRWGQLDLAGNVWEWNLDWSNDTYAVSCANCANLSSGTARVVRGGSFQSDAASLATTGRVNAPPSGRSYAMGARCARDAP